MFINKNDNSSANFYMPDGFTDQLIERPFPLFEKLADIDYAASVAVATKTMEASATIGDLTGNIAVAVSGTNVAAGAKVYLKMTASGAARTVTAGTGVTGADIVIAENAVKIVTFLYDGTTWLMF